MKTFGIGLMIIVCMTTAFILFRQVSYFGGSDIEAQERQMLVQKAAAIEARKVQTAKNKAERKAVARIEAAAERQAKPLDVAEYFKGIELTPLQKIYSESIVAAHNDHQKQLEKQLGDLKTETGKTLWNCLPEVKTTVASPPTDFTVVTIERFYQKDIQPSLDPAKKTQAEAVFQNYTTRSKEIGNSLKQSRQMAGQLLQTLLTKGQKDAFQRLHAPPKTPAPPAEAPPSSSSGAPAPTAGS